MTGWATAFFVLALAFSVLDWVAVARRLKPLEYVCKPAAALAFLAAALALTPASDGARTWLGVALVFCVLGDIFLMLPRDAFIAGLGSFAVAQVLFTLSFTQQEPTRTRLVIALVIVLPAVVILARRFISGLVRSGGGQLIPAVVIYMLVISAMAVGAISGGTALGIAGAFFFLISDAFIAEQRFVAIRRWQPLTIIVTYHAALAGLVLGQL